MEAQYPINVYKNAYVDHVVQANRTISDLSYSHAWPNLIKEIKAHPDMVNTCRLPTDSSSPAKLFTPLHQAAHARASKEVFEALLKLGASKCLKTAKGETAYDIAKRLGMSEEILNLLEVPKEVSENYEEIQKMEAGLHEAIKGRVEDLITKNGQALPQLAFLYEFGEFWYPVPGMYGGFSVTKHEKGIEASSWIRVVGGSGQRHVIDRTGKVTLEEEGFC
ncbi:uncharacterized protein LOC123529524 isoform X2 [Mercenaria mercenaria]|nr:uncharacterized protein LOC123529524 isoform X2 [Mercenaria mercenaria]XP_045165842.1 uncharacterized protein LOC123529524 isoform X2 [Mercenaria mercenaria]XP_053373909.1 uncharacterized protein LOC123529524 isoform X2 [Mercenaria mercenaria]XP_053373918.1 uncharacterized protein LOC123529524 isoform X2 [Mercenaria mercenaria]